MTTSRSPVTAETALFTFYDIESLSNVFSLCAYTPRPVGTLDELEVFFLADDDAIDGSVDPQALYEAILASNPGLPAVRVKLFNLRSEKGNLRLAELIGLSDADQVCHRGEESKYPDALRPVCDTDPEYDPAEHPFLAGYNSMNYDTTMIALYLSEAFPAPHGQSLFQQVTADKMREHNDKLFSADYIDYMPKALGWDDPAAKIRMSMLRSGRHLDVARLNELQQKVGLKRLLGMLGHQIKESEKLSHDTSIATVEELYELLAYNVSDCLGLSQLFEHPTYSSAFDLKAGLLYQYDETRYSKSGSVRRDRLAIDSSSAKFVGRILAPYASLRDIESVSFMYPHPEVAAERGVEPVNVLDECIRFFEDEVVPDRASDPAQAKAHAQFMKVAGYYRVIEGQNFNDSEEYREAFPAGPAAWSLRDVPKTPNNLPYFLPGAQPSACFATFSTGGIHGAEADMTTYRIDAFEREAQEMMIDRARRVFPDAKDFVAAAKDQHSMLPLPDGSVVDKRLVLLGSDPEKVKYRKPKKDEPIQAEQLTRAQELVPDPADLLAAQRPEERKLDVALTDGTVLVGKTVLATTTATGATYREEPAKKAPELFVAKQDGSTKLHPKYARTSAGHVIHEDFTSYYPNLLRNMRAFYNPELGEDRYAKIFFDKERYGEMLKNPEITEKEQSRLTTLRNGTKLILNSASGAGDAAHRTPIRMNNQIISMRILGQLFSWRIGQAQTLAGARIISTNTDGLYSVLDWETNNRVLDEQSAQIGVDIEPEPMFLISKDSNNRLELMRPKRHKVPQLSDAEYEALTVPEWKITAAGGGTLACHGGPRPDKALAHPAVIDFALARYLQTVSSRGEESLAEPFDPELGRKLIDEAVKPDDPVKTLRLFQNVIAASRGSITYPFAVAPIDPAVGVETDDNGNVAGLGEHRALQMINRVFIVRPGTARATSLLNAGAWKVNPASQAKRRETGNQGVRRDPVAVDVLRHHGWAISRAEASSGDGLVRVPDDQDVVVRRINSIDPAWPMLIVNDDLHTLGEERVRGLIESLDLDVYTGMLRETFEKNWRNAA